jgi:hypothetical protein
MEILKAYAVQLLIAATILIVIYLYRDEILKAITGANVEEFKADLDTIRSTDIGTFASDIYATIKTSVVPGGYISPSDYRAKIAEINAQLIAQGIKPGAI